MELLWLRRVRLSTRPSIRSPFPYTHKNHEQVLEGGRSTPPSQVARFYPRDWNWRFLDLRLTARLVPAQCTAIPFSRLRAHWRSLDAPSLAFRCCGYCLRSAGQSILRSSLLRRAHSLFRLLLGRNLRDVNRLCGPLLRPAFLLSCSNLLSCLGRELPLVCGRNS